MKQPYRIHLSEEEHQVLIDELEGVAPQLREKLLSLRDRNVQTVGAFEFRGLDCTHCGDQTVHFKKYKSSDRWHCDECGAAA